ncbi:C-5 sterol desaturase [Litoreibacter ponti]|uniref:C-5 sterol desaturase n=1 Tax=Litoreibacter ponti TaxID=1510457 RepID=A0A2T6BK40_9RHOB|nr:sterol desaturase family protein [Litoreibacter ponti]PTX56423.1 C-5 sterol desaturase [Litoreibacter ponti]
MTQIDEHNQPRDRRGEWRPNRAVRFMPLFDWPTTPRTLAKWFFGIPGFLVPWYAIYLGFTLVAYLWFTPEIARMQSLSPGWALEILARNVVMVTLFTGGLHLWLYRLRGQGRWAKYNGSWPAERDKRFLFNNQVYDNVFWSIVGVVIWTGFEVGLWWGYANGALPFSGVAENPVWFVLWMLLMPFWRNFHFYWIHRLIHWPPLYRSVHYLHHKNVNVGPWSGLAMHPVEHLLYFSCLLIHLVVPSHPLHMMFNGMATALGPGASHSGFDEIVFGDEMAVQNDKLMHYLHHRYHSVNFGENAVPLDKWFGSFHDGTPEADARFRAARTAR